jgi:RNA binding exosome subunit
LSRLPLNQIAKIRQKAYNKRDLSPYLESMSKATQSTDNHYTLEGVVERFEDKVAIIVTADKQTLRWPIKNLPEDCEVGTAIRLIIRTDKSEQQEREKIAKTMLNQILKNEPPK